MAYSPPSISNITFDQWGSAYTPPAGDNVQLSWAIGSFQLSGTLNAAVVSGPVRSQEWTLKVLLGGVDISQRVTGTVTIDDEESSARVATFTVKPAVGQMDVYSWVRAEVSITLTLSVDGGPPTDYLMYTGIVDTPAYDVASGLTECTCTNDLQNFIKRQSHSFIDQLTPNSKWSKFVFDELADSWQYLQDRMSTYPYAVDRNLQGVVTVYDYRSSTVTRTFDISNIIDGSLSVTLANARDLVNYVEADVVSQYNQYRETVAAIHWSDQDYAAHLAAPATFPLVNWYLCQAQMPIDAITGAGATLVGDPDITVVKQSEGSVINTGASLSIYEFIGEFSKRYAQNVQETQRWVVQSPTSISQVGLLRDSLSANISITYLDGVDAAFSGTREVTKWMCSAFTGTNVPKLRDSAENVSNDPLLAVTNGSAVGFIPYPCYSIKYPVWDTANTLLATTPAFNINSVRQKVDATGTPLGPTGYQGYGEYIYDFDAFIQEGNAAQRDTIREVVVAQATQKITSSHRQNSVAFGTYIAPEMRKGNTIRLDTSKVVATGVIKQLTHTFDVDKGSATTHTVLAISYPEAVGIPDAVGTLLKFTGVLRASVVDKTHPSSLTVNTGYTNYCGSLCTYYEVGDMDTYPFSPTAWGGYFPQAHTAADPQFVLEFPELPVQNTGNFTIDHTNAAVDVTIPADEFILYA
mgnify:CR=1 FL=1